MQKKTRTEKVNTNHLCVVVGGRVGEGKETFKGKKKQFYNVEEVDQTSASPENKHNIIINLYLAPDLFPVQRINSNLGKTLRGREKHFI